MKITTACFVLTALASFSTARASEPQTLTAQVGDVAFESGDDEITLVPIGDKFSLGASTQGAAAWPPPKTRIDRLSITCDGFADGKPLVLDHKAFERSVCDVHFEEGRNRWAARPTQNTNSTRTVPTTASRSRARAARSTKARSRSG
jgi:hypothetical protein